MTAILQTTVANLLFSMLLRFDSNLTFWIVFWNEFNNLFDKMCWIINKICCWKVVRNTGQWNLFITGRVSILKCYVTVSLDLTWVGVNSWPGWTSTSPYFTCKPNWIFYHIYMVRCSYDPLTSSKRVIRASYHMLHLYGNGPWFETKHTGGGVHIRSRWQFICGIYWKTCFWACDYVPYTAYQHTSSLEWHKMSVKTTQFTCPSVQHLFKFTFTSLPS